MAIIRFGKRSTVRASNCRFSSSSRLFERPFRGPIRRLIDSGETLDAMTTEIRLEDLPEYADRILQGQVRGRAVVVLE